MSRDKPTQLYRHYSADGRLLYVGISLSAVRRLGAHAQHASWFGQIARVEVETHPSRRAALVAEVAAIKAENPLHNVQRPRAAPRPRDDEWPTCGGCKWQGGWDQGAGRLGPGAQHYCWLPSQLDKAGKPGHFAESWQEACSKREPYPPGEYAEEYIWLDD